MVGLLANVGLITLAWLRMVRDRSSATSPSVTLARQRRFAIEAGAVAGTGIGVPTGLVAGFAAGVGVSFSEAWPSYEVARIWLALRRHLPWPLMGFLADAHRRGVLRQAGAVYQFRHIELQHRLAVRDAEKQQAKSTGPDTADVTDSGLSLAFCMLPSVALTQSASR